MSRFAIICDTPPGPFISRAGRGHAAGYHAQPDEGGVALDRVGPQQRTSRGGTGRVALQRPGKGCRGTTRKPYRASNSDLWFQGTRGGRTEVARYDGSTWQIFTKRDGLIDTIRNWMEGRDGSIWYLEAIRAGPRSAGSMAAPERPIGAWPGTGFT